MHWIPLFAEVHRSVQWPCRSQRAGNAVGDACGLRSIIALVGIDDLVVRAAPGIDGTGADVDGRASHVGVLVAAVVLVVVDTARGRTIGTPGCAGRIRTGVAVVAGVAGGVRGDLPVGVDIRRRGAAVHR